MSMTSCDLSLGTGSYPINIASFHDVHLGHDNTTTAEIITGLQTALPDNDPFLKTLDYLVFPGDLFDRLLHLPNHGVPAIRAEIRRWLQLAEFHGFIPMILEGTPSHDWRQSKMIESVATEMGFKGEYYYVDRLAVITTSKGHSFLFVPDEWRANNEKTYQEAVEAIAGYGLTQVDFCLFHGQFEYQFPDLPLPCHDSTRWQKLVRHYLFAGHIHKHSRNGNILVAGSFDRLCHGEEKPKGHLRVTVNPDGNDVVTFVENPLAKIYNTYDVRELDIEAVYALAAEKANGLPVGSFIRLWGTRSQGLKQLIKTLESDFPQYRWSIKLEKPAMEMVSVIEPTLEDDQPRESKQLTREVMFEEITHRLLARKLDSEIHEKAMKLARSTLC